MVRELPSGHQGGRWPRVTDTGERLLPRPPCTGLPGPREQHPQPGAVPRRDCSQFQQLEVQHQGVGLGGCVW